MRLINEWNNSVILWLMKETEESLIRDSVGVRHEL